MSKELIVSVNGREKKIAIIENDRVTEFYIERGEQNQGIVGNIYKGRVMRVLPGMQSAFVDIGLERDAFLYVSDFFDEEAEFERIVVDKSKKGDAASAARAQLNESVIRNASVDSDIAYAVASVHALAGDLDAAFEWLKRSVALGNENKPWFERDPNLAALRGDPRFEELIRRITR